MKKLICSFYLFLFSLSLVVPEKQHQKTPQKSRKEFIITAAAAEEKDAEQMGRIKEIYKNQYLNQMHKFQMMVELEKDNIKNLEGIHLIYERLAKNVDLAKGFLLDRMDQIYDNFIQPARWNY